MFHVENTPGTISWSMFRVAHLGIMAVIIAQDPEEQKQTKGNVQNLSKTSSSKSAVTLTKKYLTPSYI